MIGVVRRFGRAAPEHAPQPRPVAGRMRERRHRDFARRQGRWISVRGMCKTRQKGTGEGNVAFIAIKREAFDDVRPAGMARLIVCRMDGQQPSCRLSRRALNSFGVRPFTGGGPRKPLQPGGKKMPFRLGSDVRLKCPIRQNARGWRIDRINRVGRGFEPTRLREAGQDLPGLQGDCRCRDGGAFPRQRVIDGAARFRPAYL